MEAAAASMYRGALPANTVEHACPEEKPFARTGKKNRAEKTSLSAPTQNGSGPPGETNDWAVPAVPQRTAAAAAHPAPAATFFNAPCTISPLSSVEGIF